MSNEALANPNNPEKGDVQNMTPEMAILSLVNWLKRKDEDIKAAQKQVQYSIWEFPAEPGSPEHIKQERDVGSLREILQATEEIKRILLGEQAEEGPTDNSSKNLEQDS